MKTNRILSGITGALVLFLALGAFVLSYDALRALALANGVTPRLVWLWPLIVDGAIVVFSLAVLRASLHGERAAYPWLLVAMFAALSVLFNVLHAGDTWLARGIAAVPPVALFLSFELLMGQVKHEVRRAGAIATLTELSGRVRTERESLDRLTGELDRLEARRDALKAELSGLRRQKREETSAFVPGDRDALDRANGAKRDRIARRREQVMALVSEGLTHGEIAGRLDVSTRTIRRDIRALNGGHAGVTS